MKNNNTESIIKLKNNNQKIIIQTSTKKQRLCKIQIKNVAPIGLTIIDLYYPSNLSRNNQEQSIKKSITKFILFLLKLLL